MSLDTLVEKLSKNYHSLTKSEVRAVATDILYSGEPYDDVIADTSLVDKLVDDYRDKQRAAKAALTFVKDSFCPICKMALKPVELSGGRQALFCTKHFVVYPKKER